MNKVKTWFKGNKEAEQGGAVEDNAVSSDPASKNHPAPIEFQYGLDDPIFEDDDPQVE